MYWMARHAWRVQPAGRPGVDCNPRSLSCEATHTALQHRALHTVNTYRNKIIFNYSIIQLFYFNVPQNPSIDILNSAQQKRE